MASRPRINGAALRAIRERSGYNGATFAARVAISPQFLSDIERGRRGAGPDLIRRMAEVLVVPIPALLGEPGFAE